MAKKIALLILLFSVFGAPARAQSTISGNPIQAPSIPSTCPALNVGIPYSCQFVAAGGVSSGGIYNWSESGSLPPGLIFTVGVGGGLLSGTPSNGSAFPVTITATDNVGAHAASSFTLQASTLTGVGPCGIAVCVSVGIGSVNASATLQLTATGFFSNNTTSDLTSLATWSCTAGSGCTGTSINASGLLTAGTTTGSGTAQASFGGVNGTGSFTVVSSATVPIITFPTSALANGQIYQPYSEGGTNANGSSPGQGIQLAASGGTPPYTWTCSTGAGCSGGNVNVAGLTLSSSGLISGTPTASGAGASMTLQVTDSASHSNTVVIPSGITIASVSTITANLAQSSIAANTSTNVSAGGAYSDSTSGTIPSGAGGASRYNTAFGGVTGSPVASLQVSAGTATTTGDFAIGIVTSYINSACTGYTATITSPNETFTAVSAAVGKSGVGAPYYNCYQMFYAQNITGNAADQPTCNWTATAGVACMILYYHGMLTSGTLDQSPAGSQSQNVGLCAAPSITTTAANELIAFLCGVNSATSISPPAGYGANAIVAVGTLYGVLGDIAVGSIQTSYAPTSTITPLTNEVSIIASFKATSPSNGSVTWASGNTACATVGSSTGLVTALPVTQSCTATITPTYTGSGSPTINAATVTVTVAVQNDTGIIVSPSSQFATVGTSPRQPYSALGNVTGDAYSSSWGSSNTSIATVNPTTGTTTTATCASGSGGTVNIAATSSQFTSPANATLTCNPASSGQIITAAGCDPTSVANALPTSAQVTSSTVTINIPSCSSPWSGSSVLNYTVPSNVSSMIIHGNTTVSCNDSAAGTSSFNCTPTDATIFSDASTGTSALLHITVGTQTLRITGITMQGGAGGANKVQGLLWVTGSTQNLRIDHSHFNTLTYSPSVTDNTLTRVDGNMEGVFDHDYFSLPTAANADYAIAISVYTQNLDTIGYGDGSWSSPSDWGSQHAIFLEQSVVSGGFTNDCDIGGRQVFRYNTFLSIALGSQMHPTYDQGSRFRSCRTTEGYKNYFGGTPVSYSNGYSERGGTGLYWGNTLIAGYNTFLSLYTDRATNDHAISEGSPPNSWGYCGTQVNSGVGSAWDANTNPATGYPCIDGVGRGQGQALNGAYFPSAANAVNGCVPSSPASTSCSAWPKQFLEPTYTWMNATPSGSNLISITDPVTTRNVDAFVDNSGCAGGCASLTTGTGYGPLANRPTTCTAGPGGANYTSPTGSYGVAYWATDGNGGNGVLYVCSATNTWTQIYTPYTYPHPLDH